MRQHGAEFLRQRAITKAAGKWNKQYLRITDEGFHQPKQVISAGCRAQKQSVTQSHNSSWKFPSLLRSIMEHSEAERDFLFLGVDKDKQHCVKTPKLKTSSPGPRSRKQRETS